MPSFALNKKINYGFSTIGEVHKNQSDLIMEATWWNDISSQVAYLYDYYHDDNISKLDDMQSIGDQKKIPIDIKFIMSSTQTYDKDPVSVHIQLRPSQKCNVNYYEEFFSSRYDAHFPCGLYIDIKDSTGKYNRWLIVGEANTHDNQFPTYDVLRCNKVIQYIYDGKKYQVPGVLRSQSSYNSGVWTDYVIETVEDQQKFVVPMNRDTEKLYYNQRLIIDNKVLTEPRTWQITKVNRIAVNGLCLITTAQTMYDEHTDYVELDKDGNIIGMWADYYKSAIEPSDYTPTKKKTELSIIVTSSGIKPEIKCGGSYKKFTANYYDANGESIPFNENGKWSFAMYNADGNFISVDENLVYVAMKPSCSSTVVIDSTCSVSDSDDIEENQIKLKFIGADKYLGNIIRIIYTDNLEYSGYTEVQIVAL